MTLDEDTEFARVVEQYPCVISYVKNRGLGLEVPYKDGSTARHYLPDFIVWIDDGQETPLNLFVEVKGFCRENVKLKSETMWTKWVPGVNNLKSWRRWEFVAFSDVYEMDTEFKALIERVIGLQKVA